MRETCEIFWEWGFHTVEWIIQNAGNILVGALVLGALIGAVLRMRSGRKNSKCSGCPYSGACGKEG